MLPAEWIKYLGGKKDEDLLFNKMNLVFVANMLLNTIWLPFFQSNSQWGFIASWFVIVGIWATNTYMMAVSSRNESWWLEALMVRIPFSVYSGWVTCATVLNSVYMLMSWGGVDRMKFSVSKNNGNGWWSWLNPMMDVLNENTWSIVIIWGVEAFFEIMSWWMRNPIWGSVFTWAGAAILNNQIDRSDDPKQYPHDDDGTDTALLANTGAVVMLHAFSMALLFVYLVVEQLQPWYEPIPFW